MPSSFSTDLARRAAGALAITTLLAGCSGIDMPGGSDESSSSSSSGEASATKVRSSPAAAAKRDDAALDRQVVSDLERVIKAHPEAHVSVAVAPVGGEEKPEVVGWPIDLIGWSTVKIPVALAVVESGQSRQDDIESAITVSDNEAAERLWSSLGSPTDASKAVEKQIRLGGDKHTRVPGQVTAPGHSAPGQTTWELADQATFTSNLPCLTGSSTVTDPMGRVHEEQQWGLGQVDDAQFKGGWGQVDEGFIVRQLGLIPGKKGDTAVTLQMRAETFEEGTAIADELGTVLKKHQADLPTGTCSS